MVLLFTRLPTSFLPNEDQGYIIANVQLPPGATQERTLAVMQAGRGLLPQAARSRRAWSACSASASPAAARTPAWPSCTLKDWDERKGAEPVGRGARRAAPSARSSGIRDAFIFALSPPPIPELGNATGFTFRLQDRGGVGHDALVAARNQLLGMAAQEQGAGAACGRTAWKTRRSCRSTSTATRPARWA